MADVVEKCLRRWVNLFAQFVLFKEARKGGFFSWKNNLSTEKLDKK
jgi:hypothetical protein